MADDPFCAPNHTSAPRVPRPASRCSSSAKDRHTVTRSPENSTQKASFVRAMKRSTNWNGPGRAIGRRKRRARRGDGCLLRVGVPNGTDLFRVAKAVVAWA
jgi:hypothetical protein